MIYGAGGIAFHPEITRLLLERGADPNDGETPYHSPESYDNAALEVLVESGKLTADSLSTMLLRKGTAPRQLAEDHRNHARSQSRPGALYAEGDGYFGIARNSTALHVAAWHAMHSAVKLLIELGAPIDASLVRRGRVARGCEIPLRLCGGG